MRERHPSNRELVQSIDGELPARRLVSVDAHLAWCEACRARRHAFEQTLHDAKEVFRPVAIERPNLEARARLEVALADRSNQPHGSWAVRSWQPGSTLRAAVTCAAVFAAALLLGLHGSTKSTDVAMKAIPGEWHALPIAVFTPGAVRPARAGELCSERYPSGPPVVPASMARQVLHNYGLDDAPLDAFELDYLITPELGGALDASNLWPQPYQKQTWNALVKDELERLLPDLVCSGRVTLEVAQRDIASDWIAAYRKYFRTRDPLANSFGLSRKLS